MSRAASRRGAIHFGRFDFSVDGDLEKLVGWTGGKFYVNALGLYGRGLSRNYVHNLATISEIEALPEARLYNAYFEQELLQQCAQHQDRTAGGRRRVLRQPDRRSLHQRHVRLAGQQGQQSSLRRTGAADRGARHSRQGHAVGPDHGVRRRVQRQCGAAGRRRPAASRQSRPGVPGQRSAVAHRTGALELRSRLRQRSAGRQFHAGRLVSYRTVRRSALHRARRCRSPIPAEPALPQNFAAISESLPSSSRRCTGRPR